MKRAEADIRSYILNVGKILTVAVFLFLPLLLAAQADAADGAEKVRHGNLRKYIFRQTGTFTLPVRRFISGQCSLAGSPVNREQ